METPQHRAETKELEASSIRTSKTPKEGRGGPGATVFLEEAIGWQRGERTLMMWPLGGVRWGKKRGKPAARPPAFGLEHCAAGDASRVEKRGRFGLLSTAVEDSQPRPAPGRSRPVQHLASARLQRKAPCTEGAHSPRPPRPGAQPGRTRGPRRSPEG